MKLTDKIRSYLEWQKENKVFQNVLTYALQRQNYKNGNEIIRVAVPKILREEYFELFIDSVNKKSIQHGVSGGDAFLDQQANVPFYGRDSIGANFVLTYLPEGVNLTISSCSFRERLDVEVSEAGLFSTYLNEEGTLQTDLAVGENFKYWAGFGANHSISKVLDKLQKSKIIPAIPSEILMNLKRWEKIPPKLMGQRKAKLYQFPILKT